MPSRIVEKLKEKVERVHLRSSLNLNTLEVSVLLAEQASDDKKARPERFVVIELPPKSVYCEHDPSEHHHKKKTPTRDKMLIRISDIIDVKVKNFNENSRRYYVLAITCPPMEDESQTVQLFLMFDDPEKRDLWGDGLRSLYSASQWATMSFDGNSAEHKLHPVKKIKVRMPRIDEIVRLSIDTDDGRTGLELVIPAKNCDSELCKQTVNDFATTYFIAPAEKPSIYRFVRSLISRMLLEQETAKLIDEIDASRYPRVVAGCRTPDEARNVVSAVEIKLRDLQKKVPERIGHHGPASEVIAMIFKRNIEKTKEHNKVACDTSFGATSDDTMMMQLAGYSDAMVQQR